MSVMMRPDSGTKSRTANEQDVNKFINDLQHQLMKSRAETQKVKDKLSCLISLVRRSWNGDRNASIHLANIVGLDMPTTLLDSGGGTAGRPVSRVNTQSVTAEDRAAKNWERLAIRLLQRDYMLLQSEIQQHQQRYMENRSRFMDEVMHFHQRDMARTPFSRPSSAKLFTIDQQFLHNHSVVGPDGRNEQRKRRVRSAITRRPKMGSTNVEPADVRLRDLFVENTPSGLGPASNMSAGGGDNGPATSGTKEKPLQQLSMVGQRRYRQDYDDSRRYVQGNLFSADELLTKKPVRPVSSAVMQERDRQRARPRSAVNVNANNNAGIHVDGDTGERPLKYETTCPVSGKMQAGRIRKGSTVSTSPQRNPQLIVNANGQHPHSNNSNSPHPNSPEQTANNSMDADDHQQCIPPFEEDLENDGQDLSAQERPPISVRVKNAITKPESVDKFTADLQHMEEMEAAFRKNTAALQRKLGLPESGMI